MKNLPRKTQTISHQSGETLAMRVKKTIDEYYKKSKDKTKDKRYRAEFESRYKNLQNAFKSKYN